MKIVDRMKLKCIELANLKEDDSCGDGWFDAVILILVFVVGFSIM